MKNNDETSEGLNQILEIINAKGDKGELEEIVARTGDEQYKKSGPTKN